MNKTAKTLFCQSITGVNRETVLADRKARSVVFKTLPGADLGEIKRIIEAETTENAIQVFQEIGPSEYLLQLSDNQHVEYLLENGFDTATQHHQCHPPHGLYTNVSILGLKAFISDDEVTQKLQNYGEIKGEIIRLKYKNEHALAGLENGNRLIRMMLTAKSIPYSLNIGGEWCRIIHHNQIQICSHCNEEGHGRRNCPEMQCRICKDFGHMSITCTKTTSTPEIDVPTPNDEMEMTEKISPHPDTPTSSIDPKPETETAKNDTEMEFTVVKNTRRSNSGTKRQHQTDSDSDTNSLLRRPRIKIQLNINIAHRSKKNT